MIAHPPVEQIILLSGGCIEVVRAANHHYLGVVINEGHSNATKTESVDDCRDVSVHSHVFVPKEAHCMYDAGVIVEEAR